MMAFGYILRSMSALVGFLLLYVALFLHEDEEGNLQNRLISLWVRIDDLRTRQLTRNEAFVKATSMATLSLLEILFGDRPFSALRFRSCVLFSTASGYIAIAALLYVSAGLVGWGFLFWGGVAFAAGLLPLLETQSILNEMLGRISTMVAVIVFLYAVIVSHGIAVIWYSAAVLCDFLFIIVLMWACRYIAVWPTVWRMILVITVAIAVSVLFAFPFFFFRMHEGVTSVIVFGAGLTNGFDAGCIMLVIGGMCIAVAHRVIWPIIQRPVYAAQRRHLLLNSKLLGCVGIAFLAMQRPSHSGRS